MSALLCALLLLASLVTIAAGVVRSFLALPDLGAAFCRRTLFALARGIAIILLGLACYLAGWCLLAQAILV